MYKKVFAVFVFSIFCFSNFALSNDNEKSNNEKNKNEKSKNILERKNDFDKRTAKEDFYVTRTYGSFAVLFGGISPLSVTGGIEFQIGQELFYLRKNKRDKFDYYFGLGMSNMLNFDYLTYYNVFSPLELRIGTNFALKSEISELRTYLIGGLSIIAIGSGDVSVSGKVGVGTSIVCSSLSDRLSFFGELSVVPITNIPLFIMPVLITTSFGVRFSL